MIECFIYYFIYLFIYLFIRVNKYSKASCKMIGEIHLRTKSICISLASIFKSYLPKGHLDL